MSNAEEQQAQEGTENVAETLDEDPHSWLRVLDLIFHDFPLA